MEAENVLTISRVKQDLSTTPGKRSKMKDDGDGDLSLINAAMNIQLKALSNQDKFSTKNNQERTSDLSAKGNYDGDGGRAMKNSSMVTKKIKRKSKNTQSEPNLFSKSTRNRSQHTNMEGYHPNGSAAAQHCEKCAVVLDAQVAALNLS